MTTGSISRPSGAAVSAALGAGVVRFVADLDRVGIEPVVVDLSVRHVLNPVGGLLAGKPVTTGVALSELQGWPTIPPHWIHLPEQYGFAHTNADVNGCSPGWRRHSRDLGGWVLDRDPILNWLAHVRAVLGQVTTDG
jgi:hypothetical protein